MLDLRHVEQQHLERHGLRAAGGGELPQVRLRRHLLAEAAVQVAARPASKDLVLGRSSVPFPPGLAWPTDGSQVLLPQ